VPLPMAATIDLHWAVTPYTWLRNSNAMALC
jgi:hypothetical protein